MINFVWPVPRVISWLRVTFSEIFKASLRGSLGLRDSNSSNLITTGGIMKSRVNNEHNTLNRRWFNVNIMFIRQKKISTNIHVVSTNFFNVLRKDDNPRLSGRALFDIVLMGKNLTMYFLQRNFGRRKSQVVLMYFFDANSMCGKSTQLPRTYFDVFEG